MVDEALGKLIEFLQTASPVVWQALIKQVYIEAFAKVVWAIGLALVALFSRRVMLRWEAEYEEQYDDGRFIRDHEYAWLLGLAIIVLVPLSFGLFVSAVMWFINPEFYAIRYILQQIK